MDGKEHEERCASRGEEARAHARYSTDEECTLLLLNHGLPVTARILDLSLEGCRVRTRETWMGKTGRPVEIAFKVNGCVFRFSGMVRWCNSQRMVGIHFENMIARRKEELTEVIEEMAAAAARKQTGNSPDAEPQAPGPVLVEAKAIASPPAAPGAAQTAAAPVFGRTIEAAVAPRPAEAAAPAMETAAPQPAKPRDRRAQSRHEIDSSATIFLIKVASALRGRIIDLSLGGCRIRTDERFPVGIYTRVEVEFHLEGLPFRLGGVIQAIHNRNTVGIRFLDLSERKRQQVQELIDELAQTHAAAAHEEAAPGKTQGLTQSR